MSPSEPLGSPIVVWGAGAMGGSIGAWLQRAGHEMLLVDQDESHVHAISANGLKITGPVDEFVAQVPAVTPDQVQGPIRTVLLAVKAHHTGSALDGIAPVLALPAGDGAFRFCAGGSAVGKGRRCVEPPAAAFAQATDTAKPTGLRAPSLYVLGPRH